MGLVPDYGSDSDSDLDPIRSNKSETPLPVRKRPIKIGLKHPLLNRTPVDPEAPDTAEQVLGEERDAKRSKLSADHKVGRGSSGLLGLLPPPKRQTVPSNKKMPSHEKAATTLHSLHENMSKTTGSTVLTHSEGPAPPKNRNLDLFGLAEIESDRCDPSGMSTAENSLVSISSAAEVLEFPPPHQTLSGEWNAYDPSSYTKHLSARDSNGRLTQKMVDQGAMGHAWSGVDGVDEASFQNWDVKKGLEQDKKMMEERAKLLAPPTISEQSTYKPSGKTTGLAGKRHQLSALLKDAHSNRQALEDRIAQNKRTKREAGTKYGF